MSEADACKRKHDKAELRAQTPPADGVILSYIHPAYQKGGSYRDLFFQAVQVFHDTFCCPALSKTKIQILPRTTSA